MEYEDRTAELEELPGARATYIAYARYIGHRLNPVVLATASDEERGTALREIMTALERANAMAEEGSATGCGVCRGLVLALIPLQKLLADLLDKGEAECVLNTLYATCCLLTMTDIAHRAPVGKLPPEGSAS